ncbi:GTP-binding protein REM 1 isoform X2 [Chrysoperla carnea]|uniref:GTP-binding protein REM 1 isoform X2 n=1 Tax=Chrysoperla carnea TaxID=189513 RepID=UPI001D092D18|nr:GTP-binding protein REM 1 isoform X2 [Chrysoperla carnea]
MADDVYGNYTRVNTKGRSASICAPGSSMETLIQQQQLLQQTGQQSIPGSGQGTPTKRSTPEPGTPPPSGNRRRGKPAARSQSARITSSRSVRRKTTTQTTTINNNTTHHSTQHHEVTSNQMKRDGGSHYNSEPRLSETPEPSPGIRRRGSRRGVSVYQHRKSTAFLDVPDNRTHGSRSDDGSNADPDEDPDSYRLRSFSSTSKGIVNRGDSFRRRRSRSSSLCPGHHALPLSLDRETPPRSPGGIHTTVVTEEDTTTISRSNINLSNNTLNNHRSSSEDHGDKRNVHDDDEETKCYHVALIGAPGVGKTALISQFMTSECINAYDRQKEISEEQTVSIMLNGEESELHFINIQSTKKTNQPDAYVVIYSVVDRASYTRAETDLRTLHDLGMLRGKPILVVANKIDLARSRAVTSQDGKCLACTYRAKFIEISVGINHNVDELLVGILSQIRLKEAQGGGGLGHHSQQWYKSRGVVRASMKARQMFTWIFGKEDSKFKNCENLHIL